MKLLDIFTRSSATTELAALRAEVVAMKAAPAIATPDYGIQSLEATSFGTATSSLMRFNPDDLAGQKGLKIYAKMRIDEQVKASTTFVRDAILARDYVFEFAEDSPLLAAEQDVRKAVICQIIERMPGSFVDALSIISTGRDFGFSLTEKVYQPLTIQGKQWVGLRALLGRDPTLFQFYTDEYGELERCEQWAGGKRVDIDLAKFIHYVHNPEFDRWFGRSDLREAHRSWYAKNELIKLWLLGLEKLAGGMLVASVSNDAGIALNSTAFTALQNTLRGAKTASAVLLPPGVTAEMLSGGNMDGFQTAIEYHDQGIAKALLIPQQVSGHASQNQSGGNRSQAETQLESFAWRLASDTQRLEAVLNEQLFRDLGDLNWGDGEYPQFCFKPLDGAKLQWLVTTWATLIGAGAVIPTEEDEGRLREILEMPPRDDKSTPLAIANQQLGITLSPQAQLDAKTAADAKAQKNASSDAKQPNNFTVNVNNSKAKMSSPSARDATLSIASARERVDFAVIDRRQTVAATQLAQDIAGLVAKAVQKVLGDDANVTALTDSDPSDIANIELAATDVGRIKAQFQKGLADSWAMGRTMAQAEVRKTGKKLAYVRDAAHFADLRNTAAGFFEANSFRMAGNVADGTRGLIQQELQNSVKFGRSPGQTREAIWSRLVSKGFSSREAVRTMTKGGPDDDGIERALDALELTSEEAAAAYLNTLARTNLFEAMNEARYAEFTDPALDGFVVAFRYSAIMDDRTTEICSALHDHVWSADSDVWDEYRPPNHFNCRSVLIPITKLDQQDGLWNGEESADPTVQPQDGFGGGA